MAKTLAEVIDASLVRLGDTEQLIWDREEMTRYAQEGYDTLCQQAQVILETDYLEDYGGNLTAEWEKDYLEAGMAFFGLMTHTAYWERDYLPQDGTAQDIADHTAHWEKAYRETDTFRAVYDLPPDLVELERATWNNKRLTPMDPAVTEVADSRYEEETGEVEGYLVNKDGWQRLRKWRVPSIGPDEFTTTGNFGILRDPDDISEDEVTGTWGIPRILPGMHLMRGPYGFPRRAYQDVNGTRIEFYRRGEELVSENIEFELPDICVKYIQWFCIGRALTRQGPGQDMTLGEHWMSRFATGLARLTRRKSRTTQNKIRRIEDGRSRVGTRPPLARMPWAYGKVVS